MAERAEASVVTSVDHPPPTPAPRPAPAAAPNPVVAPLGGRRSQPGKRALDLTLALVLGIVLLPVIVVVALAVLVSDGRPVLYRQRRVGRDGEPFTMLKFRSMRVGADTEQDALADHNEGTGLLFKVSDDPRVTPVGRVIRRAAIDELPQLWNVIQGDMSIVGPRPLPVEPDAFDAAAQARHVVRPGITGLWQTSTRDRQDYDHMVELDLEYVRTWSVRGDLAIVGQTVPALLGRRRGA